MLLMKDIIRDGHATLRQKAEDVSIPLSQEDQNTLKSMLEYLHNSQDEKIASKYGLRAGVGLAAPQINVLKKMIAILVTYEDGEQEEFGIINPKIISHSEEMIALQGGEGCLSVDDEHLGYVPRYARITVEGYDLNGKKLKLRLSEYLSIVFQHEIDHLHGILFYDRINKKQPMHIPDNMRVI